MLIKGLSLMLCKLIVLNLLQNKGVAATYVGAWVQGKCSVLRTDNAAIGRADVAAPEACMLTK